MPPRTRTAPEPDTQAGKIVEKIAPHAGPGIRALMIRIMRDVLFVGKDQRNKEQRYSFRGIDDVTKALSGALREHGVLMLPQVVEATRRDAKTTKGNATRETILRVCFTFTDEFGDSIEIVTEGESLDSGDKGTAKAMSVAWRTAMIIAFALPTDEPDPDSFTWNRGDYDSDDRDRRDDRRGRGRRDDRDRGRDRTDRVHDERSRDDRTADERDTAHRHEDEPGDELRDTDDPDVRRDEALLQLREKIKGLNIDKEDAGDRFFEIFGEELPDADAVMIETFCTLVVTFQRLPLAAEVTKQRDDVTKITKLRDEQAAQIRRDREAQDADPRGADGDRTDDDAAGVDRTESDPWGSAPPVDRSRN
jgi:hypothetical protein